MTKTQATKTPRRAMKRSEFFALGLAAGGGLILTIWMMSSYWMG